MPTPISSVPTSPLARTAFAGRVLLKRGRKPGPKPVAKPLHPHALYDEASAIEALQHVWRAIGEASKLDVLLPDVEFSFEEFDKRRPVAVRLSEDTAIVKCNLRYVGAADAESLAIEFLRCAIRVYNWQRGIEDTRDVGRFVYHNAEHRNGGNALGIVVKRHTNGYGWWIVEINERFAWLPEALRKINWPVPATAPRTSGSETIYCACGNHVRVTPLLARKRIVRCDDCKQLFEAPR